LVKKKKKNNHKLLSLKTLKFIKINKNIKPFKIILPFIYKFGLYLDKWRNRQKTLFSEL